MISKKENDPTEYGIHIGDYMKGLIEVDRSLSKQDVTKALNFSYMGFQTSLEIHTTGTFMMLLKLVKFLM